MADLSCGIKFSDFCFLFCHHTPDTEPTLTHPFSRREGAAEWRQIWSPGCRCLVHPAKSRKFQLYCLSFPVETQNSITITRRSRFHWIGWFSFQNIPARDTGTLFCFVFQSDIDTAPPQAHKCFQPKWVTWGGRTVSSKACIWVDPRSAACSIVFSSEKHLEQNPVWHGSTHCYTHGK